MKNECMNISTAFPSLKVSLYKWRTSAFRAGGLDQLRPAETSWDQLIGPADGTSLDQLVLSNADNELTAFESGEKCKK